MKAFISTAILAVVALLFSAVCFAATKQILYFTRHGVVSTREKVEITEFQKMTVPAYSLKVLNGQQIIDHNLVADYVAGSVPAQYRVDGGGSDSGYRYPYIISDAGVTGDAADVQSSQ